MIVAATIADWMDVKWSGQEFPYWKDRAQRLEQRVKTGAITVPAKKLIDFTGQAKGFQNMIALMKASSMN